MKKENYYNFEIRSNISEIKEKDIHRPRKIPQNNPFRSGEIYSKNNEYMGEASAMNSKEDYNKNGIFMSYHGLKGQIQSSGLINTLENISEYLFKKSNKNNKIKIDFIRIQEIEKKKESIENRIKPEETKIKRVKSSEDIIRQWEWKMGVLVFNDYLKQKNNISIPNNFREYKLFKKLVDYI